MLLRIIGYIFGIGAVLFLVVAAVVMIYIAQLSKDLPDYEVLANYQPPVTTRFYAGNGALMAEYARERRLYLPIQAIPDRLKDAFLSAEDKSFYSHIGIDPIGIVRAIKSNLENIGTNRRKSGASTITQQVAKNFLLTSKQDYTRKIKEAILALRMERTFSKDKILELYMNKVNLGLRSHGVGAAALAYFNKSVNELTIAECAYFAALLKAPNNYHPFRHTERAIERRNWVIDRMVVNNYISHEEGETAKAEPLKVTPRGARTTYIEASGYFSEEVRRRIIDKYGNDTLYAGGLAVRTTLDPQLQLEAQKALRHGLTKFDKSKGYRGPVAKIDPAGDWGIALKKVKKYSDVQEWELAVVLAANKSSADIGLQPKTLINGQIESERKLGVLTLKNSKWALRRQDIGQVVKSLDKVLAVGDVVYVEKQGEGDTYKLQQIPKVGGGLVAMDPNTGRVLAMTGGFSFSASQFNRATQAKRQPGSSFKPFVYAAALDNGYTPSTVVLDGPIKINQGGSLGFWEPKNYGGKNSYAGPTTLRRGIEKSKNLMTVRLAKDMGMDTVAEYAERFGIYDKMLPVLANSLGAEETTVLRMVSAYSVLANGGRSINPSFIDRIQDRYGKTIFKHDQRICEGCNAQKWEGQAEPEIIDNRDQVLDPMTAYQITSMMEGVVQRGTAQKVKVLERPIAGKTGTTNEEKDAWFVGYSPTLVVGVYVGYDTPKPMGRGSTGGGLAAPIFIDFMQDALKNKPVAEFRIPEGLQLIPINAKNGLRANGKGPGVILEAFKPGSGPPTYAKVIGFDAAEAARKVKGSNRATKAIENNEGGLF